MGELNNKIDDSNKTQVNNLNDNVNRLEAIDKKILLAGKATDEKRRISMRLTLIELYKIEPDATKRIGLMRLINNTINPQ